MEKINAMAFLEKESASNQEAKQATLELLKQQGEKCYVAMRDWADETTAVSVDDVSISIFAVGKDENDGLLIAATVDNIGYGNGPDDFPQGFVSVDEIKDNAFPGIYRFVAANIENTVTREEAEEAFEDYY